MQKQGDYLYPNTREWNDYFDNIVLDADILSVIYPVYDECPFQMTFLLFDGGEHLEQVSWGNLLSYKTTLKRAQQLSKSSLYRKDGGHNKYLEHLPLRFAVYAPRHWWLQFSTYRVGISRLQESTMHTLAKRPIVQEDFATPLPEFYIEYLNLLRETYNETKDKVDFLRLKDSLPEGYLQWALVTTNYKTVRNMYQQRKNHKNLWWRLFFHELLNQIEYPKFITDKE